MSDVGERAESLLEDGLQLYSEGLLDAALERWEKALVLDPALERAREYIDYVSENRAALERSFSSSEHPAVSGAAALQDAEKSEEPAADELPEGEDLLPDEDDEDLTPRIDLTELRQRRALAEMQREAGGWTRTRRATPLTLVSGGGASSGSDFSPDEPTPVGEVIPQPARVIEGQGLALLRERSDPDPEGGARRVGRRTVDSFPADSRRSEVAFGDVARDDCPAGSDGERAESMLRGAHELFEQGTFEGSLWLCERILRLEPTNSAAKQLLERNQQILLEAYERKLHGLDRIPVVRLSRQEIMWHKLDHRAGFLLSRIDGLLTYDDVLDVCGMGRFEACRILAQLLEQGVIGPME